jgi:cytochrome b561
MSKEVSAPMPATSWRYGGPAIVLHWTLAPLLAVLLGLGWYMMSIEDEPGSDWYFDLHKSLGLVLFALVLSRMAWRVSHRPAPLPASVAPWEARISSLTHIALYACMFLMPIFGFLGASYSKAGVRFFGARLPSIGLPNHDIAERFFGIHSVLAWILVALIVLHAVAGLKHLLVDKDGVFQRMWLS